MTPTRPLTVKDRMPQVGDVLKMADHWMQFPVVAGPSQPPLTREFYCWVDAGIKGIQAVHIVLDYHSRADGGPVTVPVEASE